MAIQSGEQVTVRMQFVGGDTYKVNCDTYQIAKQIIDGIMSAPNGLLKLDSGNKTLIINRDNLLFADIDV